MTSRPIRILLLSVTLVSHRRQGDIAERALDTSMKLLFHIPHAHGLDPPSAAGRASAPSVESPRARLAAIAVARCGAAQTLRLPPARYAGAVRGFSVARPGDPARGRRGDADPDPADRECQPGRCTPPIPRASRSGLSAARRAL